MGSSDNQPGYLPPAANQRAFAKLLDTCECCGEAEEVLAGIRTLDTHAIEGLGPAVANLLYVIHPTLVCPFNTAIVEGFNAIASANVKLGRWDHYLALRKGVLELNHEYRALLSNDLGAVARFLPGAYFSVEPLFDVALCLLLSPEMPSLLFWCAAGLMALGAWLHLRERHEHPHAYELLEHTHGHQHDEHRQHEHDFEWDGTEPWTHPHVHVLVTRTHTCSLSGHPSPLLALI